MMNKSLIVLNHKLPIIILFGNYQRYSEITFFLCRSTAETEKTQPFESCMLDKLWVNNIYNVSSQIAQFQLVLYSKIMINFDLIIGKVPPQKSTEPRVRLSSAGSVSPGACWEISRVSRPSLTQLYGKFRSLLHNVNLYRR